jgi:hypothetical protein
MKLILISQNLQGLNDLVKVAIVRNYFRPLLPSTDIICVQEHKLRGPRLVALGDAIWPKAAFYAQEAALGYRHGLGDVGAWKGGVCTWDSPMLQHLVLGTGYSRCGRVQWICLTSIPGGDILIINVSASTDSGERTNLWLELIRVLSRDTSRNSAFCDYINDSVLSHLGQERLSQVLTRAVVVDKSYWAFPVVSDMSSIILLGSSLMVLGDVAADVGDGA